MIKPGDVARAEVYVASAGLQNLNEAFLNACRAGDFGAAEALAITAAATYEAYMDAVLRAYRGG